MTEFWLTIDTILSHKDKLAFLFLSAGCFFVLSGVIGMFRFPDFLTRLHAAGVIDSCGVLFIILGLVILAPGFLVALKLIALLIFFFITGATACHALAKAALARGPKPAGKVIDNLERLKHGHINQRSDS